MFTRSRVHPENFDLTDILFRPPADEVEGGALGEVIVRAGEVTNASTVARKLEYVARAGFGKTHITGAVQLAGGERLDEIRTQRREDRL